MAGIHWAPMKAKPILIDTTVPLSVVRDTNTSSSLELSFLALAPTFHRSANTEDGSRRNTPPAMGPWKWLANLVILRHDRIQPLAFGIANQPAWLRI